MSASIRLKRRLGSFDDVTYTAELHKNVMRLWNEAIAVFIETAARIVATHQDTGMSLASLVPAADKVGADMPSYKIQHAFRKGYNNPYAYKSIAHGERLGAKAASISYGTARYPNMFFTFDIKVYQYQLNEHGHGKIPAPFLSLAQAKLAMIAYLRDNGSTVFPSFAKHFKFRR